MVYCVIYNMDYFIEKLYETKLKKDIFDMQEKIDFIYLYYLEQKGQTNLELMQKLLEKYKSNKSINKEIKNLKEIKLERKIMIDEYKKQKYDFVILKMSELEKRLEILALCFKYKILIKYLKIENNEKIDKLIHWNLFMIKNADYIEDKIYLM